MPSGHERAQRAGIGKARPGTPVQMLPHDQAATMRAWERFVSGEPASAADINDGIAASWQRSAKSGVDPRGREAPIRARGDAFSELRWRHRNLIKASAGLFAATRELFLGSGSIVLLTSPDGVVLEAAGDISILEKGQRIHLTQGGDWRESSVGTNGIGTALATRKPVYVHGTEHFCEGIKGWSCAAAPICEAGSGALLGVIDISGPPQTYQRNNLAFAVTCARQIEVVLAEFAANERVRLLEACLQRVTGGEAAGLIAIDRRGRLVHNCGRVSIPFSVGEHLPGFDEELGIDEWARRLPEGLRPEWLSPVVVGGQEIGAMLVVPPVRSKSLANTRAPENSEADPDRSSFTQILGRSPAMAAAIHRGRQLVGKRVAVLITGDTGVGKELFARAIHGEADPAKPFITYNCGAATKELIGSDLFGHVRGAFTGATNEGRAGRFELAHGGTLCLDEIGELPLELQPVLLRVLEEGVIHRLGDPKPRRVDVRLMALTNLDLRAEVEAGRFRSDLYFRISVTRLEIPPLRERSSDIELLIRHFNARLAERHGVSPREFPQPVLNLLQAYPWPGNVRELRNVVESALLIADGGPVAIAELPREILEACGGGCASTAVPSGQTLDDCERAALARAVADSNGNLTQAARLLGISRSTLYRKMERFALEVNAK